MSTGTNKATKYPPHQTMLYLPTRGTWWQGYTTNITKSIVCNLSQRRK